MQSGDKWFVRNEDGRVFGPCGLDTLAQWSREGRIAPSSCVSRDKSEWMSATLVPELEMRWIVEVAPRRFFGPVHSAAIDDLAKAGSVPPDARRFRLWDAAEAARAEGLAGRCGELERGMEAQARKLEKEQRAASDMKKRAKKLTSDAEKARAEAKALRAERDSARAEAKALGAEVGAVRAELEALRSESKSLLADAEALRAEAAGARADAEGARLESDRLRAEINVLRSEMESLRRKAEEMTRPEVVIVEEPSRSSNVPPRVAPRLPGAVYPLAELEAQARRELARMQARGKSFFGGKR